MCNWKHTFFFSEFVSVLAFRQQHKHPNAFGRSDFYIVCRMRPLTFTLNPCHNEISKCQWMNIEDLKRISETTPITKRITNLVLLGLEKGFDQVDIVEEEMKSIYKGLKYHLYHRPIAWERYVMCYDWWCNISVLIEKKIF